MSPIPTSPEPVHILLVDDDEDDYVLTRDLLAEIPDADFRVDWVADFERALEVIVRNDHDLVLVDYRLGRRDGLELIRECQRLGAEPALVLLTGQGERRIDRAAMEAGAADYLEKSRLDAAMLERTVRYTLQKKRHADELERLVRERTAELAESNRSLQAEVAERSRAEAAIREASRLKDEFLATLAHELRNPLAPIVNSLEIVRLTDGDPAVVQNCLGTIGRQVKNLVRLIDGLLDVTRLTRGKVQLIRQVVAVDSVVQVARETVAPLVDRMGHELIVDLPAEPILLDGDSTRLAQVIANLLNNAAKYTDPGGRIELIVRARDHEMVLSVRDNGLGLPAGSVPRIFEMFTQVDRGDEHPASGMGIGLWLVDTLVKLHGGRVDAESEGPGLGSEFRVFLPLHPAA
jgi:signal transduction histidine kinase